MLPEPGAGEIPLALPWPPGAPVKTREERKMKTQYKIGQVIAGTDPESGEINFCPEHTATFSPNSVTIRVVDTKHCVYCAEQEEIYGRQPEEEEEEDSIAVWHEGEPVNEFNLADYERKNGILR
jgi:hypothetical protein